MSSFQPGSRVPQQKVGGAETLTYDEAAQQGDAQRDGQGKSLHAALFGGIGAFVGDGREDVFHPERHTRTHLQKVTSVHTAATNMR